MHKIHRVIGKIAIKITALILCLLHCACGSVHEEPHTGSVTYVYSDVSIQDAMSAEEAASVAEILRGKRPALTFGAVPACGFSLGISFELDGVHYAVARDTCGLLQNQSTQCYVKLSDAEIAVIHALFESRGGYFPCV